MHKISFFFFVSKKRDNKFSEPYQLFKYKRLFWFSVFRFNLNNKYFISHLPLIYKKRIIYTCDLPKFTSNKFTYIYYSRESEQQVSKVLENNLEMNFVIMFTNLQLTIYLVRIYGFKSYSLDNNTQQHKNAHMGL